MLHGKVALWRGVCVSVVLSVLATSAWAAPLLPGTSALAAAEPDPIGGALVAGPLTSPLAGAAFTASVTSWVYSGDTTNPFPGGLTFVYMVTNSDVSTDSIGRFTVNGYMSGATVWQTDASFQPGVGLAPATMDRSANGNVVGYSFVGPPLGPSTLTPGASSMLLVVQTNAPAFTQTIGNVIDGSIASGLVYAPVPEPTTLLLLVGGLALLRRRR